MNALQYNVASHFNHSLSRRWASVARQPDVLCYGLRAVGAVATRAWLASYFGLRIDGRENLPARGSFVMVANHASHLDALCLLAALPLTRVQHAHPAAAADYFFNSPAAGALSGVFINALPFSRKGHLRQTLTTCRNLLAEDGNILILFPEGTRSTTGAIARFKGGIGELVAGTRVPVVPCYLNGAHNAWPKGKWLPRPRKLALTIGQPMRFAHLPRCRQSADVVAMELETAVRALANQRDDRSIGDECDNGKRESGITGSTRSEFVRA
jgi:1-acyl-sn-glycerol-3-phosphate acyltransferase